MTMHRTALFFIPALLLLHAAGCTLANRKRAVTPETRQQATFDAGSGNAYLFDIKITQSGKKHTARLDIYKSGDTLGFFARAYLGKGVMKGVMDRDSVKIYFPTEDEYYAGPLAALADDSCLEDLAAERLILDLFGKTAPEAVSSQGDLYLTVLEEKAAIRRYRLESKSCGGGIAIEYDRVKNKYAPLKIEYSSGDGAFQFEAERRNIRLGIKLPPDKFSVAIPPTAARIYR